ncbi:MAG: hypothetical protein GXW99_05275 [Clostridiales bacterium]|nr:hypothetical protein [Clostridiales bacterium]
MNTKENREHIENALVRTIEDVSKRATTAEEVEALAAVVQAYVSLRGC